MQTGQDLGVVIMVQTNAADQKLLVYLPDHRAAAGGLTLSHGGGHSRGPFNLWARQTKQETPLGTVTRALFWKNESPHLSSSKEKKDSNWVLNYVFAVVTFTVFSVVLFPISDE